MKQDFSEIGREFVHVVVDQIGGQGTPAPERILVPSTLVTRGTTAPSP